MENSEIVLITGGSGFIGQHIIKHLLEEKDALGIKEIRSVDLIPYKNAIGHPMSKDLKTFIGDICQPETLTTAFEGVNSVFHCAATISLQYPPNYNELERVNVDGTRHVIEMCIKFNVKRLIYTSCASVAFVPFKGHSTFAVIINQTESKASTPIHDTQKPSIEFDKGFLIPGYSSSKLRAENIVINSTGAMLSNQIDYLQTVAMRPPLTYGEGDNHFMPIFLNYLSKHGNIIPRIGGAGGKHQLAYAGNIAWGHLCAYKTLKTSPKKIAGLPVFITDDTPINDISRFVQRIGRESETLKFNTSLWYIPHFLFFFLAFLIEMAVKILHPITKLKLKYSLRALSSFTASVLFFNRLRAAIHTDYFPRYDEVKCFQLSTKWYEKWHHENIKSKSPARSHSRSRPINSDKLK